MPGSASTVHNQKEIEPARLLDDPAGRRIMTTRGTAARLVNSANCVAV